MTYYYLFKSTFKNPFEEQHSRLTSICWLSLVEELCKYGNANKMDNN